MFLESGCEGVEWVRTLDGSRVRVVPLRCELGAVSSPDRNGTPSGLCSQSVSDQGMCASSSLALRVSVHSQRKVLFVRRSGSAGRIGVSGRDRHHSLSTAAAQRVRVVHVERCTGSRRASRDRAQSFDCHATAEPDAGLACRSNFLWFDRRPSAPERLTSTGLTRLTIRR